MRKKMYKIAAILMVLAIVGGAVVTFIMALLQHQEMQQLLGQ